MHRLIPYIQTLFLTLFINSVLLAQESQSLNFNVDNGLPSNHVYATMQDKLGYIWILTDNGVVKYDGYDFKVFTTKDRLPTDDMWMISEDNLGNKWLVGSYTKQQGFIKDDKYRVVHQDTVPMRIYKIFHKGDSTFFEYFFGDGIAGNLIINVYDGSTNRLTSKAFDLRFDKKEYLSFSADLELIVLDSAKNLSVLRDALLDSPYQEKICDSFYDHYHAAHVSKVVEPPVNGTYITYRFHAKKIFVLKPHDCEYREIALQSLGCSAGEYIIHMYYRAELNDYVVVTNEQIICLDADLLLKEVLLPKKDYKSYNIEIPYIMTDNAEAKWLSTSGAGVYMKPFGQTIFKRNNKLDILKRAKLSSCSTDDTTYWYHVNDAKLYVVCQQEIIDSIQLPKEGFECFVSKSKESSFITITTTGSSYTYNTETKKLVSLSNNKKVRYNLTDITGVDKSIVVKGRYHHWHNDSIIYTANIGFEKVYVFDDSIGLVTNLFKNKIPIRRMHYDAYRDLYWIISASDIAYYKPTEAKGHYITTLDEIIDNISIRDITSDVYGNMYVLNSDDVYLFYPELGIVKKLNKAFGLEDAKICVQKDTIVIAGEFGLAYAKIKGVCKVDDFKIIPNSKNFAYRKIEDLIFSNGIITLTTDRGAYSMDIRDEGLGKVGVGTANKLLLEYPNEQEIDDGNDTVFIGQDIQLLRLNFVNFAGSGSVRYKYMLDNKGWNSNLSGEIFVGNLKPGVPHRILCTANDDIWSTSIKTFNVYRYPYWYQTVGWRRAFWVIGILGLMGLVVLTIGITRYIVARNNEKKQQMTDLQLRAIYSQINPHFIFNSLSSALYFIDNKKFDDAYNHVSKFSKLLRSYLKSSQERFIVLADEINMLKNYIDLQQIRFEEKFDYSLEVDNKIPAGSILIPSLLLQPIVENAISHGLFHMIEKGWLKICFKQGDSSDELICIIEDNGVGRKRAEEIKNKSSERRESYGTRLTQKLMEIFKEYEDMNISMEYFDKEPPERGTTVTLIIKNLRYVV